jgi:prophage regulatory protein
MSNGTIPSSPPMPVARILRLREVCHTTGLGRSMIYCLQQARRFPQSVKITDYAVGWLDTEIQTWLAQRAASRARRPQHASDERTRSRPTDPETQASTQE